MLELILKKKWYDMIDCGEKKEEYRDLKPYWWARIFTSPYHKGGQAQLDSLLEGSYNQKHYTVRFRLGYKKNAPEMIWRLNFCTIGKARPEWAENEMGKMIVIPLRDRLSNEALQLLKVMKKNDSAIAEKYTSTEILNELKLFRLIKPVGEDAFGMYEVIKN